MKNQTKLIVSLIVFAVFLVAAVLLYQTLSQREEPEQKINVAETQSEMSGDKEPTKAPDFALETMDGESVRFSDLAGKPIVLNFWASWCGPCKTEMPEFETVYQELSETVTFVMVNLTDGERETRESAAAYVDEQGFTFPVYLDTAQEGAYGYAVRSIPTTYFIDEEGTLVAGVEGMIDEATLRKGIALAQGEE